MFAVLLAGCDGGSGERTDAGFIVAPSLPSSAELILDSRETDAGTEILIAGQGWADIDRVYLLIYPSARSFGEVFRTQSYLEIGGIGVVNGGFSTSVTIDDMVCLKNGECHAIVPGEALSVAASVRTSDRTSSSQIERIVIQGD